VPPRTEKQGRRVESSTCALPAGREEIDGWEPFT